MKHKYIRKILTLLLSSSLLLSANTGLVYAAPAEPMANEGQQTEEIDLDTGIVSEGEDLPPADEEMDDTDTSEAIDSSDEMTDTSEILEEEEVSAEESEEITPNEAVDFVETGIFGAEIKDHNGAVMKTWYDEMADRYYLFLTNAISLNEVELPVTGVLIQDTSAGTLDKTTNTIRNAFAASGDIVTLTAKDGKKYSVQVKQSGIPSLSISLNGISLAQLNGGTKDDKYAGQSVILTDASGNVNVAQSDVEIKGRGNSTWTYSEKKPYQIKFAKRQSVLGMENAKKWVLLANAFDDTMLRNQVGFSLSKSLGMTYTPGAENVELWIDGEYRGLYTIGGKCEIDTNRLNLTDPLGALVEVDNYFYSAEEHWFRNEDLKSYFVLSDCVDENLSSEALENLQYKLIDFTKYLLGTDPKNYTIQGLQKYINVDDFAKWYLIHEYLLNTESAVTSWYWYVDGPSDVLHLGPVWDFDSADNNAIAGRVVNSMAFQNSTVLFKCLMASPAFSSYVKNIFRDNRNLFSCLSSKVYSWAGIINAAADANYTRWKFLGKPNQKDVGKRFENTYEAAVAVQANWLAQRDQAFFIDVPSTPSATISTAVSDSGKLLTVNATDLTVSSNVSVAVWSATGGQDDLKWYSLSNKPDGSMSAEIDLKKHGSSDTYYAHVYCGKTFLGADQVSVTMQDLKPECVATYSEKTGLIHVTVKNAMDYADIKAAVWTAVNGQDDLKWITKSVNGKAELSFDVDVSALKGIGSTEIHVYGVNGTKMTFLAKTSVTITEPLAPIIEAVQLNGEKRVDIKAEQMVGFSSATAAVWGTSGGQNDLKWYTLKKNQDGSWSASVDVTAHKETGLFNIHVYGMKNNKNTFAGSTTVNIAEPLKPEVKITTVSENEKYKATLTRASMCTEVSFAVWGDKDSQNDLTWYKGTKTASGNWVADIPVKKHMELGRYNVHAYGMTGGKNQFQGSASFNVTKLPEPAISTMLYPSGKTVKVTVRNTGAFSEIKAAVWGSASGQNDLKWYNLSAQMNGQWEKSINLYSHNELGNYNIHLYGTIHKQRVYIGAASVNVEAFEKPVVTCIDKGSTFLAKSAFSEAYDSVRFAVWTEANGQDDLKWYSGAKYSDGSWRFFVKYAAHGGNGKYNVHAYGTKGGKDSYIGSYVLNKTDLEKPVITTSLNSDQTKLTIKVDDTIGYSGAKAAVWGSVSGQNDLRWYNLTYKGDGLFSATIDIAAHKEEGTFNIHVYGTEAGKQFFMASDTVTVTK